MINHASEMVISYNLYRDGMNDIRRYIIVNKLPAKLLQAIPELSEFPTTNSPDLLFMFINSVITTYRSTRDSILNYGDAKLLVKIDQLLSIINNCRCHAKMLYPKPTVSEIECSIYVVIFTMIIVVTFFSILFGTTIGHITLIVLAVVLTIHGVSCIIHYIIHHVLD